MPTVAFYNLSDEKKKIILEAAKIEFSKKLFEDASINQIIKSINMPRGTFYLYFENKEDIYTYLFQNYKTYLIEIIKETLNKNKGNIFDAYIALFDIAITNANSEMESLINNFFINMNSNRLEKNILRKEEKNDNEIFEHINVDILNISNDEVHTLISILMPLFFQNVACAFIHKDYVETIKENYIKQINIIRKGIERM